MQQESSTDLTKERAASLCPWKLPELLPCASGNFYNCFLCSWKLPELFSVFLDISRAASFCFWKLSELLPCVSGNFQSCFLCLSLPSSTDVFCPCQHRMDAVAEKVVRFGLMRREECVLCQINVFMTCTLGKQGKPQVILSFNLLFLMNMKLFCNINAFLNLNKSNYTKLKIYLAGLVMLNA